MKDIVVETAYGKLRGTTEEGVHSFKGIPYGGPTDGPNRFMPPAPPESWSGIREATRYGQSSWQVLEGFTRIGIFGASGIRSMSEDCLFLNVWTPALNDQSKRPVMVWLHGGGFFLGSGDQLPFYDGASLAKTRDVVVVTVNHRLGVFGYLHLEEVAGEKYTGSGNAGMLDLVAALEWVRDNIATFGGNPGNVTIFGESGGGEKVSYLMAMPAAKGLFHHAIIESGPGLRAKPAEEATRATREFLEIVGISPDRINLLHEMRADMINSAWMTMKPTSGTLSDRAQFSPVIDGNILPAHPFDPVAAPTASDVPLLIGTNKDEMTFMLAADPQFGKYDEATMRQSIMKRSAWLFGHEAVNDRLEELISTYRRTRPGSTPHDILMALTTDRMRVDSIRLAERKAASGQAPVYMYLFTWESPAMRGMLKSCHTLEMPFVFNNAEPVIKLIGDKPERLELAEKMSGIWAAFSRSGDPNHEGIPQWPAYSAQNRSTMILNTECRVENDPYSEERQAWDGII